MHPPTPRPYQSCPFFLSDGFKHCWKVCSSGQAEPAQQYHNISFTSKKQQVRQLQYFSLILPFPQPASKSSPSRCMFFSLWNTRDAPGSCWRSLVQCFNKKKIKNPFFNAQLLHSNSCLIKMLLCERDWTVPKTNKGGKIFPAINIITEASSLCLDGSTESRG